jgi:O-antigen/teichoic acid export membrane protein
LSVGVLINSLAHVPFVLLQSAGRPDIPAKFHLIEVPIYGVLLWLLLLLMGVTGAALAWFVRVTIDASLLFAYANRSLERGFHAGKTVLAALWSVIAFGVGLSPMALKWKFAFWLGASAVFGVASWILLITAEERGNVRGLFAHRPTRSDISGKGG